MSNEDFQNVMLKEFKGINNRLDEMNKRFDDIEIRLSNIEEKIDTVDFKIDSLEAKNAIRHMEIRQDITNVNIINAKNNLEIAQIKKII